MTPRQQIQQVPLDRATQLIYAQIHAAMAPLRAELAKGEETSQLLAGVFTKFQESLPTIESAAYKAMRKQLAQISHTLQQAVHIPLSFPTRILASQLLDHDLPRLASIAMKLNEEEAPIFFAAINYTDSTFEAFAVDAKQKTTIRKADLEAAIQNIVSKRMVDFKRHVKEDTAKWLAEQGIVSDKVTIKHGSNQPRFTLRRDLGVWRLVFDGRDAVLKHERGILYVVSLLYHPPKEPIQALELAAKIPGIYRKQLGLTSIINPITGNTVPIEKHSMIQERSSGIDDRESARRVWKMQQQWQAVLDDPKATEPEKAEALQHLEEVAEFLRTYVAQSKSNAEHVVRAVRRAITRFIDHLSNALDKNGNPHPVLRAFAKHLHDHLILPTISLSKCKGSRGYYCYEPPPGLKWFN